jgi:hypothetical protein
MTVGEDASKGDSGSERAPRTSRFLIFSFSHSGELLSIVRETKVGGSSIFRFVWVNILKLPSLDTSYSNLSRHQDCP